MVPTPCPWSKLKQRPLTPLTWEASWVKMASKANIFGAAAERLCAVAEDVEGELGDGSSRVSCFLWLSTFRKDMDSDVSREPGMGHIRTITLTCKAKTTNKDVKSNFMLKLWSGERNPWGFQTSTSNLFFKTPTRLEQTTFGVLEQQLETHRHPRANTN